VLVVLQGLLSEAELEAWGWRLAFGGGGALAIVVFFIRRRLDETLSYKNAAAAVDRPRSSGRNLFRDHPREALLVMALTAGGTAAFYAYTIYLQKFLVNTSGFDRTTASRIMTTALAVMMLIQPLAGLMSDRIGRKPIMIFFGTAGVLFTYPLFTALETTREVLPAFALVMASLVIVTGYTSINAVVKAELFPTTVRALGVGLPYALTVSIFGGTADTVALWFKSIGHEEWFYYYLTAMIGISLVVYLFMRDTKADSAMHRHV
jgi:MFS transporter, MHS family, alpha-ketoglutarate permease